MVHKCKEYLHLQLVFDSGGFVKVAFSETRKRCTQQHNPREQNASSRSAYSDNYTLEIYLLKYKLYIQP